MHILVIDDDPSVGAAIQAFLNHQGCEVVVAENSTLGIRAFETSRFDVVLVDIFMPGTDGLETIKDFRQRRSNVPIIAMSGFRFRDQMGPTADFLSMAVSLGATCCLRKPFGSQNLMAAINGLRDHVPASTAIGS